jgi:hypothetical protein
MMKMRMWPMEATRTGMENQDSKTVREENRMATTTTTTTTMVPSTPNTAMSNSLQGGRDKDTQDQGWERMRRGREGR